ncbi:MAG TPA: CsgG/HfaB family protein [Gemmatimonadales bacterium]|nr:CsgG/HfaB family protein [Gemmatimonadales bacterium]
MPRRGTVRLAQVAAVCVWLAAAAAPAPAQGIGVAPEAGRLRLAVMELNGSALRIQQTQGPTPQGGVQTTQTVNLPQPPEFARTLTEILTTSLITTGRFVVLERQQMQAVLAEQDLNAAGRVNKETGAAQGHVIGAQAMITGDITGFAYTQQSLGGGALNVIKNIKVGASRVSASVIIDLRLIDAATGEVLASATGDGNASSTGVAADLTKGDQQISASGAWSTPLGQASRAAITKVVEQLVAGMPEPRWSAKIVEVRDDVVYLNAGADGGVSPGQVLEVYDVQPPLIDPDTGRNLGAPDKLLGEIQVETVLPGFSTAKVVSGTGFARNNVVRRKS